MIRCVFAIDHVTKATNGVLTFQAALLYGCIAKFILILMGSFEFGSVIEVYCIFFLQTCMNIIIAWTLHSKIISFHKPEHKIRR